MCSSGKLSSRLAQNEIENRVYQIIFQLNAEKTNISQNVEQTAVKTIVIIQNYNLFAKLNARQDASAMKVSSETKTTNVFFQKVVQKVSSK